MAVQYRRACKLQTFRVIDVYASSNQHHQVASMHLTLSCSRSGRSPASCEECCCVCRMRAKRYLRPSQLSAGISIHARANKVGKPLQKIRWPRRARRSPCSATRSAPLGVAHDSPPNSVDPVLLLLCTHAFSGFDGGGMGVGCLCVCASVCKCAYVGKRRRQAIITY